MIYLDKDYYLDKYVDVAKAGVDPLVHYLEFGVRENRNPSASFNTKYYLENNPDVQSAGMNPLVHYFLYGQAEGRSPLPCSDIHTVDRTQKSFRKRNSFRKYIVSEAQSIVFPNR